MLATPAPLAMTSVQSTIDDLTAQAKRIGGLFDLEIAPDISMLSILFNEKSTSPQKIQAALLLAGYRTTLKKTVAPFCPDGSAMRVAGCQLQLY